MGELHLSVFEERLAHALGHQVGRFAHDGTALLGPPWEKYTGKVDKTVEAGMVFTIEPRLTTPDHGVATIENMVVVTDGGAETRRAAPCRARRH